MPKMVDVGVITLQDAMERCNCESLNFYKDDNSCVACGHLRVYHRVLGDEATPCPCRDRTDTRTIKVISTPADIKTSLLRIPITLRKGGSLADED